MKRIIPVFLLITILGCSKDASVGVSIYPLITTLPVTEISNNSAVLKAEFTALGDFEIVEYGFSWYAKNIPVEEKAVGNNVADLSSFSSKVPVTSSKDSTTYFVKAYAISDEKVVYGNEVSFLKAKAASPIITQIKPLKVSYCDTIEIHGENFSSEDFNPVRFSSIVGTSFYKSLPEELVFKSDTFIKVLYPKNARVSKSLVSISAFSNISYASDSITFLAPIINTLSRESGVPGDNLIIHGENFSDSVSYFNSLNHNNSLYKRLITVEFNDKVATIRDIDCDRIELVVPSVSNPVEIKISTHTSTSSTYSGFKML